MQFEVNDVFETLQKQKKEREQSDALAQENEEDFDKKGLEEGEIAEDDNCPEKQLDLLDSKQEKIAEKLTQDENLVAEDENSKDAIFRKRKKTTVNLPSFLNMHL